jgi:uncharacterized OB-fold protein
VNSARGHSDDAVARIVPDPAVLEIHRCERCAQFHSYARAACPKCGGTTLRTPVTGRGTLYSYTVVHRAPSAALRDETPYAIGIVRLAEGPHIMGRLEGIDPDAVRIDMPLIVTIPRFPERGYIAFTAAAASPS